MPKDVKLPQLGQTMEEGTIVTSLVNVGDKVEKGDVLFEIETDKATLELESPAEGFVKKFLVEVGETVPVNTPILILGEEDEEISQGYIESLGVTLQETTSGPSATEPAVAAPVAEAPIKPAAAPPASGPVDEPAGAKIIRLPQLGQTMEEGTIVTTLIHKGDQVSKGDVLFEIETDKATLEMESPAEGTVKAILIENGETLPINEPLAVLADADAEVSQAYIDWVKSSGAAAPANAVSETGADAAIADETPKDLMTPAPKATGRVFASPRAKMVAAEIGIDISRVAAAAGAARITEADVRKAATSGVTAVPAAAPGLGRRIPVNRMQRIVGERMLASKREIPCFYLNVRVDMTNLVEYRKQLNKTVDVKVSFNDFLIRAVAMGLNHYPIMTGQLAGNHIQLADRIDIGLAISTDEGLVAPVIKDAFNKNTLDIARYGKNLIERAKTGKLTMEDLEGGCITISNLGGFGIDSFIPIVVPGQCSILGVGQINDTCVPMDGNFMVRKIMNLNLSVDHKVANGADAAQFLDFVKKTLEHTDNFAS